MPAVNLGGVFLSDLDFALNTVLLILCKPCAPLPHPWIQHPTLETLAQTLTTTTSFSAHVGNPARSRSRWEPIFLGVKPSQKSHNTGVAPRMLLH